MKILNPNYVDPVAATVADLTTKIAAYMAAHPKNQRLGLAELKAAMPADADKLTTGMLQQIAQNAGWQMDRSSDQ